MLATFQETATPEVCPVANSVTLCPVCREIPLRPRQKTCSTACRVAKHRAPNRELELARRNRYNAIKNCYRTLSFDGRESGHVPAWLGPFKAFEVKKTA